MIDGFVSPEVLALLFLFFGLSIAVAVKKLRLMYSFVPYTPTLFLISLGLGYFSKDMGILGQSIEAVSKIDPKGILLIFLPPLIFESGFNSDWYIFRKQATQIFLLAFPAVLIGASLIMISIKAIIQYDESCYTWSEAFMFGSVLSCTDTVAVLALLKEAGAPRKFNSLIEGESLFNDGSCMVLFTISLQLVKGTTPPPLFICKLFLELTLGAVLLGCVFGFISTQLIKKVRNSPVLTLNITVVSCYLIYFTAEYVDLGIKISGIMALVSLGIYMAAFGKSRIAPQAIETVQNFWKIYVFIAQTIIFMLGGVLVGIQFIKPEFIEILSTGNINRLFFLYICMTLARFLSISVFMPKLKTEGYGLRWNEVGALTYGGLRGAVGIAFTLILASNPTLNPTFRMLSLFNTSGCAFLTLMINAPTCNYVIKRLGLCVKSETKTKFFIKFMSECELELKQKVEEMRKNKHVLNANLDKVQEESGLPQLKEFIYEQKTKIMSESKDIISENQMKTIKENLLSENIPDEIDPALMDQVRNRFCIILKGIFWAKFEDNQCSTESIRMLTECVNIDMDCTLQPLNSWDYLISHLNNPYFFSMCYWLKNKPIIGPFAYSWLYERVGLLYDVISTYLEGLQECEQACKKLPYDDYLQAKVIEESEQNRKLAQYFLDHEIKISYEQIMKRIQTAKAAQSLLTFQKEMVNNSHQYGQISEIFYKQILDMIQNLSQSLEKDSGYKEALSDFEILKQNSFFSAFNDSELNRILQKKVDIYLQKDQAVIKSYEKQKYIYLVARGEVIEQYKLEGKQIYQRSLGFGEMAGVGSLLMNHKKQLQYSAVAVSTVSLFGFPIYQIKEVITRIPKLEQILYLEVFMLQVYIEPEIKNSFSLDQSKWLKLKPLTSFKKLLKEQVLEVSNCQLILAYGKMTINEQEHHRGHFTLLKQSAKITGPAKLYTINIKIAEQEQQQLEEEAMKHMARESMVRKSRSSTIKQGKEKPDSVLRRTLYSKY